MRVTFDHDWAWGGLRCLISYTSGERQFVAKPVELTFEEIDAGIEVEPTFRFKSPEGAEFLRALLAGLIEYGVKVPENLELRGKLEAQAEHIRFLEELVKEHWSR